MRGSTKFHNAILTRDVCLLFVVGDLPTSIGDRIRYFGCSLRWAFDPPFLRLRSHPLGRLDQDIDSRRRI